VFVFVNYVSAATTTLLYKVLNAIQSGASTIVVSSNAAAAAALSFNSFSSDGRNTVRVVCVSVR